MFPARLSDAGLASSGCGSRAICAAGRSVPSIQRSQAQTAALNRELGINPKTVATWRKRETVEDRKINEATG